MNLLFIRTFFPALILSLLLSQTGRAATGLSCRQIPALMDRFLELHYSHTKLTDELRNHTVEQFIKQMDPSKTLLTGPDVDALRKDLSNSFKEMFVGNCGTLDKASALFVKRAEENLEWTKDFLGKNYKLDENVQLVLDAEKRGYSKNAAERKEFFKKMLHFQMSNLLLADTKIDEAKKQLVHRYELVLKRIKERKQSEMLNTYVEAFANALDPHSNYLSQDAMTDFQIQMQLSLEGIGASLSSQDGFTVIEELIAGGSAERSKQLKTKDKIISVAEEGKKPVPLIDMELREVVKMIRGKKGTKVVLTILRADKEGNKTLEVTLVRDKIDIKERAAKIKIETRKIGDKEVKLGLLSLPSFYGGSKRGDRLSSTDVKAALLEAKAKGVEGIVLDVSRNGGGLLNEAVAITGLFIKNGPVVATKERDKKPEVLSDEDKEIVWSGPLVVVTSRLSASASEILAGAVKDYRRAAIVGGDHTFGKGSVQLVSDLPLGLGGIKVTRGMFFLPLGVSTQHSGVPSDVVLPSVLNTDDLGEKKLDYSLPPQSIASFIKNEANSTDSKKWIPITDEVVKKLNEKSKARVDKDPKFAEIKKEFADNAKSKGLIKLAELRKKSKEELKKKAQKDKDKEKKKGGKEKDIEPPTGADTKSPEVPSSEDEPTEAPVLQESINILLDLVQIQKEKA